MNPLIDQLLVGAIILAALGFFLLRALRRKKGCDSGCGCCPVEKPKISSNNDLAADPNRRN